jgi:cytochrome P450
MSALINEVLRIHGPGNMLIPRTANKDHYVKKIFIRKGTYVNCFNYINMNDSDNFDDPMTFNP